MRIWTELLQEPLPIERATNFVSGDSGLGGIVTFIGATRCEHDPEHGKLLQLWYESYREMAESQLRKLADQASRQWRAGRVVVLHRLGPVGVGEASVVIAVGCPHRAEAFEACQWLIDTLKQDVPIWKKDVFADGFTRWVDPTGNRGVPPCSGGRHQDQ